MKCKHKWVDMEDGSLDKFCVRCRKFAMQAQMALPKAREKVEMPFYNGSEHIRISVFKDELIKQMNEEAGICITPSLLKSASR